MAKIMNNLKLTGKTLFVLPGNDVNVQKSTRNIKGVKVSIVDTMNTYDLVKYDNLVLTVDSVKKIEEVYA